MTRTDVIQASSRSVPSGVTLSFHMKITQSHPILLTAEHLAVCPQVSPPFVLLWWPLYASQLPLCPLVRGPGLYHWPP